MHKTCCRFLGMGDDFCEEGLFGVQTHDVPQTTYNAFYVQNVRGNIWKAKVQLYVDTGTQCSSRMLSHSHLHPPLPLLHLPPPIRWSSAFFGHTTFKFAAEAGFKHCKITVPGAR